MNKRDENFLYSFRVPKSKKRLKRKDITKEIILDIFPEKKNSFEIKAAPARSSLMPQCPIKVYHCKISKHQREREYPKVFIFLYVIYKNQNAIWFPKRITGGLRQWATLGNSEGKWFSTKNFIPRQMWE